LVQDSFYDNYVAYPKGALLMPTKFLIAGVSINAVVGQLLLKRGVGRLGGINPFADWWNFVKAATASPWIWSAVAVQGFGYLLWMVVVSRVKLGVATASAGAGFYVLMALSAWGVFGESLTAAQWIGIVLITIGVTCVTLGPVQ
jgi:drug/metabolite transporter (DMT)-like permease